MQFDIIAAVDEYYGIGLNGKIPWKNPEDMQWFASQTFQSNVIMGRRTFESLPKRLPNRTEIVICGHDIEGVICVRTLDEALRVCKGRTFVIGGAQLYRAAFKSPYLRYAYITMISGDYQCDVVFPREYLPAEYSVLRQSQNEYRLYDFTNRSEMNYLALLTELTNAPARQNRTGIPTYGLFYRSLRFNLYEPGRGRILPLLTTKRVNWRSIYYELIWFMRGETNVKYLQDHGVKIWDKNSSAEFLKLAGLKHNEGYIGPSYGHQWRSWGREYGSESGGIDQLESVLKLLREDPWSRRIVVNSWNVSQLDQMALPPCHYSFQFHVDSDDGHPARLNCLVNMRSADVALGVPFNIASYALLTHIMSCLSEIPPGEIVISMCDCHLYQDHFNGAVEMIRREPRRFPAITIPKGSTLRDYTHKFTFEDYTLNGYEPHSAIKMDMAV